MILGFCSSFFVLSEEFLSIELQIFCTGSFGHFQASKSGVHKGGLSQPLVKAGFVATRISVRYNTFVTSDLYYVPA